MKSIPFNLQGILWSAQVNKLDLRRDKVYIIHQVLAYGAWEHLLWLFRTYSKAEVVKVFLGFPSKDYIPASLNFIKNILLGLKNVTLDETKYLKTAPRSIG